MNTYNAPVYDFTPEALQLVGEAKLAYIRKVYSYFFLGIVGTLVALQTSIVFAVMAHPFIGLIALFGMVMVAAKSSSNPSRAVPTLVAFTFVSGLVISPTLFAIAHGYVRGSGVATIYDALILTGLVFGVLTAYTFITKKDFSYMGASLMIGLFTVIGFSILNIFVASSALDMALAGVTVILFSGFILYDTSRIMRNAHAIPPTLAALNLYMDFLNLFLALLRLLSGGNRR